uniref:Uncharacterized protein n=1 Tax=viral metagenome TaxID=1070528 RepID=A0A6C0BJI0_9ZZZZ
MSLQIKSPLPMSKTTSSNWNGSQNSVNSSPRTPVIPSKAGEECDPEFEPAGFRAWRRLSNGKIFIGLNAPITKPKKFAKQIWQGGKKSIICAPAARSRSRRSLKGRKSTRKTRKN